MTTPGPADLLRAWEPGAPGPASRRLAAFVAALPGQDGAAMDTLGMRNQRILSLHRGLVGRPLEARVACAGCGVENEFPLPVAGILALPCPDADARAVVSTALGPVAFRLPRVADLDAAAAAVGIGPRVAMAARCCLAPAPVALTPTEADDLARQWEALDPAGAITVDLACAGCGGPIAAAVDPAAFVARDLDLAADALFRDVDAIARAYGWSEAAILELPPARRRRYVAMIAAARGSARPRLAERSA